MNRFDEFERALIEDDDQTLKDGESMRVPMLTRARMNDAMAIPGGRSGSPKATITDGFGEAGLALSRPGFRVSTTATYDDAHYRIYDQEISSRYRDDDHTGGPSGVGSGGFAGRRVGDRCTCKGRNDLGEDGDRGTIQEIDGELCCVSDDYRSDDGLNARELLEREYQAYDRRLRDSWKG